MSKKIKYILLKGLMVLSTSCLLVFLITMGGIRLHRNSLTKRYEFDYLTAGANKVVLFIGDGMGENHLKVTQTYYEKELFMTSFYNKGYVSTSSLDIFRSTDSAASATALATGQKVHNGNVGYHHDKKLQSITEYAKSLGYGVGIVTTDSLSGATPACFSSHTLSRTNTKEIIDGQIKSKVDIFLGAGTEEYVNYRYNFNENGYLFYNVFQNLEQSNSKIIGSFVSIAPEKNEQKIPTLEDLTSFAVEYLETNFPNGYFLLVECGHIDKKSHEVNIFDMMKYLNSFDKTINNVYDRLSSDPSCALIVTADHESGGLTYNNESKDQISSNMFSHEGHSLKDVPYFMTFTNQEIADLKMYQIIDNTDIYKICKALLSKNE